jgi:hypothetical protein
MKYYIIIITMLTFTSYGQEGIIIPLDPPVEYDIPNGTYVQDMNFDFFPYIGTWEGNWGLGINNKTFTLKIEKINHHLISYPYGRYYYQDLLIGKYTITETISGNVISSTMSIMDVNLAKLSSEDNLQDNRCYFVYSDPNLCDVTGTVILVRDLTNINTLLYKFLQSEIWIENDCPDKGDPNGIPIPIPTEMVTLTKVN